MHRKCAASARQMHCYFHRQPYAANGQRMHIHVGQQRVHSKCTATLASSDALKCAANAQQMHSRLRQQPRCAPNATH
eukprot:666938-Pelagomonas_calceolata.AAC.1